jgi:DNA repair protein RadC
MNGDPGQHTVIQTFVHEAILPASRARMPPVLSDAAPPASGPSWPNAERPRERLLAQGPASLSDAELLALFLGSGVRGKSALDLARELLARFGRVSRLLSATYRDVCTVSGVGTARYAQIAAVMELARRALCEEMRARDSLTSPAAVRGYLRLRMQDLGHEAFYCVFLDAQNRVISAEELFRGTLTQTSVYPREILKRALEQNAASVILAHNHPSGVAEPSLQDQALTRTLAEALALVDIKVLDHFIVAPGACLSFAERGLI